MTAERASTEAHATVARVIDCINFAAWRLVHPFLARVEFADAAAAPPISVAVHMAEESSTVLSSADSSQTVVLGGPLVDALDEIGLLTALEEGAGGCAERALRAIRWFVKGEASTDPEVAAVMYATAVESLLGQEKDGIADLVAERAAFISTASPDVAQRTFLFLKRFYGTRNSRAPR